MYNFLEVLFGVEMLFASPPVNPSTAVCIFVTHGGLVITFHLLEQLWVSKCTHSHSNISGGVVVCLYTFQSVHRGHVYIITRLWTLCQMEWVSVRGCYIMELESRLISCHIEISIAVGNVGWTNFKHPRWSHFFLNFNVNTLSLLLTQL